MFMIMHDSNVKNTKRKKLLLKIDEETCYSISKMMLSSQYYPNVAYKKKLLTKKKKLYENLS